MIITYLTEIKTIKEHQETTFCCCSVTKLCSTLQSHGLWHVRLLCPSLSPRVCSNSCPLSQWCYLTISLLSPSPLALNLSQHRGLFQWVSSFIRYPKDGSVSISPSNDCFDLLAVQGMLKSLLQHHSSKASILQRSAFFVAQLSHPHTTTGKTRALTYELLSAKCCLYFSIHCLGLS